MRKIDNNTYEIDNNDVKDLLKGRDIDANKGNFGKAGIYGGSVEYSGALKLAYLSLASLRSGCGISRVLVKKEVLEFLIKNYTGNLIIDADGLNILSSMDLEILKERRCNILLTPHLKEFSRLCKKDIEAIKKDSLNIVKEFASTYKITVLLKGHTTIISDGNDTYLVRTGCPGMATAGSGDVLSGILAGLLAYLPFNLLSISLGVLINGIAGCLAEEDNTDISMIASDTINNIGNAVKAIREGK